MAETVIERRTVSGEVRATATDAGPTTLSGYAAVFDVETVVNDWVSFREVIRPGAFAESIGRDDVRGLFNHDPHWVLGRTGNGTLRLREDTTGLHYEIDLNPNDSQAMSVGAKVARGDVSQSSFAFRVDKDEWEYPKGQMPLRKIVRVAPLYDVSPVTFPAYDTTTVSARALQLAQAEHPEPRRFSVDPDSRQREMDMNLSDKKTAVLAEARAILEAAKSADRAMSTDETQAFDTKMAEADVLEGQIERERKLEAASAAVPSVRAALPAHQFESAPAGHRVETVERKREPGESLGVLVRALRQFGADKAASLGWAEREFGASSPEYRALGWTDFTAGGATVPDQFSAEIIPLLQNTSVFRRAGAVVVPLRGTLDIPAMTGGVTAYWIGENADITPSEGTFGQKRLIEKSLAALTPMSNDLLRLGTPAVDRLIRDNIVTALSNAEDLAFFKGTGTAYAPRGIYYQMDSAHNTATAGTSLANVRTDIQDAVNYMAADNVPTVRRAWFFNPRTLNHLKWSMVDSNSNFAFPDLRASNTLNGWPCYETNNLTTATNVEWYLVEMSAIYIGDGPGLEIKVVDGAAWDNSGTVVAGFSRDQSVIRAIKKVDMVMAYTAAAVCTNTVTI